MKGRTVELPNIMVCSNTFMAQACQIRNVLIYSLFFIPCNNVILFLQMKSFLMPFILCAKNSALKLLLVLMFVRVLFVIGVIFI